MTIIKKARLQDCKIVLSFINQLELSEYDEKTFRKLYTENLGKTDILYNIAWDEKEPVGLISCHIQNLLHHNARVAEIQEMFVVENFRNRGVGKLMIESIKSELTKRDVHQLEVVSNRKRKSTHQFYLKQKFKWTSKKFVQLF